MTKAATEDKLLTPFGSYVTLEQVEACLTCERSIVGPGPIRTEILRPDRSGLKVTQGITKPT